MFWMKLCNAANIFLSPPPPCPWTPHWDIARGPEGPSTPNPREIPGAIIQVPKPYCSSHLQHTSFSTPGSLWGPTCNAVITLSDWEGKGPCAIVPFTWKMVHQSLCRMLYKEMANWKFQNHRKKLKTAHCKKYLPNYCSLVIIMY